MSKIDKIHDPHLKTIWVDRMELVVRADIPVATMVFLTALPDEEAQQVACRLQTSTNHIKKIIDVLARALDHYPVKEGK
jgi:ribosome-binding factor A